MRESGGLTACRLLNGDRASQCVRFRLNVQHSDHNHLLNQERVVVDLFIVLLVHTSDSFSLVKCSEPHHRLAAARTLEDYNCNCCGKCLVIGSHLVTIKNLFRDIPTIIQERSLFFSLDCCINVYPAWIIKVPTPTHPLSKLLAQFQFRQIPSTANTIRKKPSTMCYSSIRFYRCGHVWQSITNYCPKARPIHGSGRCKPCSEHSTRHFTTIGALCTREDCVTKDMCDRGWTCCKCGQDNIAGHYVCSGPSSVIGEGVGTTNRCIHVVCLECRYTSTPPEDSYPMPADR